MCIQKNNSYRFYMWLDDADDCYCYFCCTTHARTQEKHYNTKKNLYLILRSYYDYVFHFTCSGGDDDDADDNTRPASSGCVLFVRM